MELLNQEQEIPEGTKILTIMCDIKSLIVLPDSLEELFF